MKRLTLFAAVPLALATAACGNADQTVTVTNAGNVVLNDTQANYTVSGDGEMSNALVMENGAAIDGSSANAQ